MHLVLSPVPWQGSLLYYYERDPGFSPASGHGGEVQGLIVERAMQQTLMDIELEGTEKEGENEIKCEPSSS